MAISKVILNGVTQMDTTQKTVTGDKMLSGTTALKNDGTDVTGSIASRTSSDLTVSGATVTAPAGHYAASASKSVASGSATTPATTISVTPTISVSSSGLITASASASKSITPSVSAGYVSGGTAGTVSVSGSNTQQLTAQAAQTIHPSANDQTISSGKYLTGTQTIKAVTTTNLSAENIKKDVVVKIGDSTDDDCVTSVTGTMEGGPVLRAATYEPPSETATYMANEFGPVVYEGSYKSHTAGSTEHFYNPNFGPEFVIGAEYTISGAITIRDANNTALEVCPLSGTFTLPGSSSQAAIVYTGDSNSYIRSCGIYLNGNPYLIFYITCGKTAWYDIDITATFTSTTEYAISQVTLRKGYTEDWVMALLSRQLKNINWPTRISAIGDYAFASCSYFNPDNLPAISTIGSYAFHNCLQLALTSLPDSIVSVGSYAFDGCSKLALTSLPAGFTNIQTYTFYNCSQLALTSLPSGTTTIGASAFYGCSNLALTSLPPNLTSINSGVFYGCTNLRLTSLPDGVTQIGGSAFYNCIHLALTTLPSSLTTIGNSAFHGCRELTSISCQGGITSLATYAFNGDATFLMQLSSASFPNLAVSTLGQVFGNSTASSACQQLAFVDLGNITSVGTYAFANCYALQTMVLRRSSAICTLSSTNAFNNTPFSGYNSLTGTVYVPSALIASYQTATNWKTLYDNGTVTFAAIEGSEYEL